MWRRAHPHTGAFFDTFTVHGIDALGVQANAASLGCNVRVVSPDSVGVACGEAHTAADLVGLLQAFGVQTTEAELEALAETVPPTRTHTTREREILWLSINRRAIALLLFVLDLFRLATPLWNERKNVFAVNLLYEK